MIGERAAAVSVPQAGRRTPLTRAMVSGAGIAISGTLIIALYRTMDLRLIAEILRGADLPWLVVSVLAILPITGIRALRFYWIAPPGALPGVLEALRLTLVSSALNLLLPAKAGDLAKSYFVAARTTTTAGVAVAAVVYERVCDVAALMCWCVLGWFVGRPIVPGLPWWFWPGLAVVGSICAVAVSSRRSAVAIRVLTGRLPAGGAFGTIRRLAEGWPDLLAALDGRRARVLTVSIALWGAHLLQIWLFTVALSLHVPLAVCASVSALVLMAGQAPLTVAGIGTRDAALVILLARYVTAEQAAAVGVLMLTRNVLPPLAGLPMIRPYVHAVLAEARRHREAAIVP